MSLNLESDLVAYTKQLESLKRELALLEEKKAEIIRIGTRCEGVISYLKDKMETKQEEVPPPGAPDSK